MELSEPLKVIGVGVGLCVIAYFLAAIPFGKIIGHFYGVNVQKLGSGNIGATNLYRALGTRNALLTLGLDVGKGALPVFLATKAFGYSPPVYLWEMGLIIPIMIISLVGISAVFGACYSAWLKIKTGSWKAGKGISTLIGVLSIILGWQIWLIVLIIWFVFVFLFIANRKMSAASLMLVSGVPVLYLVWPIPVLVLFSPFMIAMIGWRHKENIEKLINGTEKQVDLSKRINLFLEKYSLEALLAKYFPPNNKKKKP